MADHRSHSGSSFDVETVSSMLGNVKIDPKTFSPLPPSPDQGLDYLYVDELPLGPPGMPGVPEAKHHSGRWGPLPMRTDGDKMLYGTGAAYMSGLGSGGLYGAIRGLQNKAATTTKLRINAVLNSTTRYGPWAGNNMGVLTLLYTSLDTLLGKYRDKQDWYNHLVAAFTTGAVFKSTAGLRQSLIMGTLGFAAVGVYGLGSSWMAGQLPAALAAIASAPRQLLGSGTASTGVGLAEKSSTETSAVAVSATVLERPAGPLESDNARDAPFEKELHAPPPPSPSPAPSSGSWLGWIGLGGLTGRSGALAA